MSDETKSLYQSFSQFVDDVQRLFSEMDKPQTTTLFLLGPNEETVAKQAEKSQSFEILSVGLFPAPMGRLHSSVAITSDVLRRSGFYGGVKSGQSAEELWARVEPRTKDRKVPWHVVLMLDGCFFQEKSFKLLRYTVNAMTDAEARALEPPQDFFFPHETVATSFTERWSLICEKEHEEKAPKPGWVSFGMPRENVPFGFWAPLFCLGLYNPAPFYITKALEGEPGYKLRRILDGNPHFESVFDEANEEEKVIPAQYFQVMAEEWERFQEYCEFFEAMFDHVEQWPDKHKRFLRLAGRRYLRATFMLDPEADAQEPDDREDALLQYMFGLEGLLIPEGGDSISYKVATRGATIAGRNDDEREAIRVLLKNCYGARSAVAHGNESKSTLDLPRLREVYRIVALVILKLSETRAQGELERDLPRLAVCESLRGEVESAREAILAMVRAPNLVPTP